MAWVLKMNLTLPNTSYRLEYWVEELGVSSLTRRDGRLELGVRKVAGSGYYSANTVYSTMVAGGDTFNNSKAGYNFASYVYLVMDARTSWWQYDAYGNRTVPLRGIYNDSGGGIGNGNTTGSWVLSKLETRSRINSYKNPIVPNESWWATWAHVHTENETVFEFRQANAGGWLADSLGGYGTGGTSNINFTAAQKSQFYNAMRGSGNTPITVRCSTKNKASGNWIGHFDYTNALIKPIAMKMTNPATFQIGGALVLTSALMDPVLKIIGGLAHAGSWLPNMPQTGAVGVSSLNVATANLALKTKILELAGGANSVKLQAYARQYNAAGFELGIIINEVTCNIPQLATTGVVTPEVTRVKVEQTDTNITTTVESRAVRIRKKGTAWGSWDYGAATSKYINGLVADTEYEVEFALRQVGQSGYIFSPIYSTRTLKTNTVSVTPLEVADDESITINLVKHAGVEGTLTIRRMIDTYDLLTEPFTTGTKVFTFTPEMFGNHFASNETLIVRIYAASTAGGLWQHNDYVDIKVTESGVVWIRDGNVWKKAKPHIRIGNEWKKATPHVRIGNEWKKAKA